MRALGTITLCALLASCGGSTTDATATSDASSSNDASADVLPADDAVASDAPSADVATDTTDDAPAGGCIGAATAGTQKIACDGFVYDVTVPAACVAGGCGLVLDVHGLTMSGKMEDDNTNMRALGDKYGYVVVQPNANPAPPSSGWNPPGDDAKVFAFLKESIVALKIDPKRVHMTGFSQGGMMTSRFLCQHADVFASMAPAAGTGCSFFGSDAPSREVHVLYMHGTKDALVAFAQGAAQRDAAIAYWKMKQTAVVESDGSHVWTRYQSPSGTVLEFVQHDYQASSFALKGHCFPGSTDKGGEPGQLFSFACVDAAAFTWGEIAMQFFREHPKP